MTLPPDLPRRATACPGWEWLPGMAAIGKNGTRWRIYAACGMLCAQGEGAVGGYAAGWNAEWAEVLGALPDLTDGATRGRLLDLVRLAWGLPDLGVAGGAGGVWRFYARALPDALLFLTAESEAELLVVALERAPVAR